MHLEHLEEARARTLALVEPVSDLDLDRVHHPLMSPLVWDLGHIAAFEDLWVCREAGLEPLRPELAAVYDADETPRADRGELPYLRRPDALDYMASVRERTAAALPRVSAFIAEMLLQHEYQHNETMLQTLQLAAPGVYEPERPAPVPRPAASGALRGGGAAGGDRGRRPRLRLRQRAPAARAGAGGVPDRPSAGHELRIRRVHRRRRLRPPRALAARGLGVPRERAGSARSTGRRTVACAASTARSNSSRSFR